MWCGNNGWCFRGLSVYIYRMKRRDISEDCIVRSPRWEP